MSDQSREVCQNEQSFLVILVQFIDVHGREVMTSEVSPGYSLNYVFPLNKRDLLFASCQRSSLTGTLLNSKV